MEYIYSNYYLPGVNSDGDFRAVNELIDIVKMADTERILIEDFTDKLVSLTGYYENK